jgi:hypothetical protein
VMRGADWRYEGVEQPALAADRGVLDQERRWPTRSETVAPVGGAFCAISGRHALAVAPSPQAVLAIASRRPNVGADKSCSFSNSQEHSHVHDKHETHESHHFMAAPSKTPLSNQSWESAARVLEED